ncbi:MAG: Undecaprenyl-phosphate galactose phosphotransferase [Gemmatimonadetes bacterium]|nr:Undecaprenyl-phosphate galactose phosphotransferase [Gemmatimonadota bacterium]
MVKRTIDIVTSAVGLLVLSPVLGAIALAILVESGRPVFFIDRRLGRHRRIFNVYKFRTMFVGSVARFNPDGSMRVDSQDARVTRVGRVLRTGFDELPQLWNVLRGEMSLVGPRPDPVWALEKYRPGDEEKLLVRPGIAGLAQVLGRTSIPWTDRLDLDRTYVRTATLRTDAQIAFLTIFELVPALRRFAPSLAGSARRHRGILP